MVYQLVKFQINYQMVQLLSMSKSKKFQKQVGKLLGLDLGAVICLPRVGFGLCFPFLLLLGQKTAFNGQAGHGVFAL